MDWDVALVLGGGLAQLIGVALVFVELRSVVAAVGDYEDSRRATAPGAATADLRAAQVQIAGGVGRSRRREFENAWASKSLATLVARLVDKRGRRIQAAGAALICIGIIMSTTGALV